MRVLMAAMARFGRRQLCCDAQYLLALMIDYLGKMTALDSPGIACYFRVDRSGLLTWRSHVTACRQGKRDRSARGNKVGTKAATSRKPRRILSPTHRSATTSG